MTMKMNKEEAKLMLLSKISTNLSEKDFFEKVKFTDLFVESCDKYNQTNKTEEEIIELHNFVLSFSQFFYSRAFRHWMQDGKNLENSKIKEILISLFPKFQIQINLFIQSLSERPNPLLKNEHQVTESFLSFCYGYKVGLDDGFEKCYNNIMK